MSDIDRGRAARRPDGHKRFAEKWRGRGDEKSDTQSFWIELLTDVEVGKTYMVPDLPDKETKSEFFRRLQERSGRPENLLFAVAKEERLIGLIHKVAEEGDRIELGYAILPAEKNRGYASEALQAMIGALFAKGFRVVEAGAFAENAASQRVMEKCGMKRLEKTETVSYRGQDHLCVYCGIENERLKGRETET